jgi:hypothetical protein
MNPNYNMEQQRDEWARMCKQAWIERDANRSNMEELQSKLAAVTQYTKHDNTCRYTYISEFGVQGDCTCGLEEALNEKS